MHGQPQDYKQQLYATKGYKGYKDPGKDGRNATEEPALAAVDRTDALPSSIGGIPALGQKADDGDQGLARNSQQPMAGSHIASSPKERADDGAICFSPTPNNATQIESVDGVDYMPLDAHDSVSMPSIDAKHTESQKAPPIILGTHNSTIDGAGSVLPIETTDDSAGKHGPVFSECSPGSRAQIGNDSMNFLDLKSVGAEGRSIGDSVDGSNHKIIQNGPESYAAGTGGAVSLSFPEESSSDLKSADEPIVLDPGELCKLAQIIEFFRNNELPLPKAATPRRQKSKETPEGASISTKKKGRRSTIKEEGPGTGIVHTSKTKNLLETAHDPRYLHFIKKTCNLGKPDALKYMRDQQRFLNERCKKNKADMAEKRLCEYKEDADGLRIKQPDGSAIVVLRRVGRIEDVRQPEIDMGDYEYAVYKYKDDFKKVAEHTHLSLENTILAYYLNVHRFEHVSQVLVDEVVRRDWTSEKERKLFEKNYKKYGKKFWKYQMMRNEKDLGIYYRYFSRGNAPKEWSYKERALFALSFAEVKKNWEKIGEAVGGKSIKELKSYYNEYFKKLSDEERNTEGMLMNYNKQPCEGEGNAIADDNTADGIGGDDGDITGSDDIASSVDDTIDNDSGAVDDDGNAADNTINIDDNASEEVPKLDIIKAPLIQPPENEDTKIRKKQNHKKQNKAGSEKLPDENEKSPAEENDSVGGGH